MLDLANNYKSRYSDLTCPVCKDPGSCDDTPHLLVCRQLKTNILCQQTVPNFQDLFSYDLHKLLSVANLLKLRYDKRKLFSELQTAQR